MILTYLPVIILLIGCLAYALSSNTKTAEMGRIMFFCGLLALLLHSVK